jgi:outer membrane biosynthesis protein TonB
MPTLEIPPNPTPVPEPTEPLTVRAGRFGELDHTELVHLLDSLDDDRSRSRFRESIYLSVIFYLALAWFVFYGPRVLFHQGRIVNPADVLKQRDKELTYLDVPKDLSKLTPKDAKAISDHTTRAQTTHPSLDKKTLEQLEAMRKAGAPGAAAPKPLPPTPEPQAAAAPQPAPPEPQQQAQARPLPPAAPTPSIPDAPKPSASTRPNFSTATNAGDAVRQAANAAARSHGQGGEYGANAPNSHQGANTGMEVLSDTQGVDFGPYLKRLKRLITASWYPLIPEECYPPLNKEGQTLIRFTIQPNGVVSAMHLDGSTHDIAIDKAAWGGITGVGQMPPLPAEFKGENLQLRIQFVITHDRSQAE